MSELKNMDYNINFKNEKEEQRITELICSEVKQAIDERKDLEDNLQKYYDNFESKTFPKSFPWKDCSNVFIPITQIHTEALQAKLMASIFGVRPFFLVKPRASADQEKKQRVEDFLEYLNREEIHLFNVCDDWFTMGLVQGTGVLKIIWSSEDIRKTKIYDTVLDPLTGESSEQEVNVLEKPNIPKLIPIDLIDFVLPAKAVDVQTASFVAHRVKYRMDDLLEKERLGIYKNVFKMPKAEDSDDYTSNDYNKNRREIIGVQPQPPKDDKHSEKIIYEVYRGFDIDGDGFKEECIFTVAYQDRKMLRAITNPYMHGKRPFVTFQVYKRPNMFYGIGVPEKLKQLQEQLNTLYNQRNDSVSICIAKVFKTLKGSIDSTKDQIYPGNIIELDNMDDLQPLQTGDVSISAYQEEPIVRDYIEKATGITDFSLGQQKKYGTGRGTATGTLALIQEGNTRFDLIIKRISIAMDEVARQILQLCYQFYPKNFTYKRIEGDKAVFENLNREDIKINAEFEIQGSSTTSNKTIEQQQLLNSYQMLISNPLVSNNPGRLFFLTKKLLLSLGFKDADRIIGSEEDIKQLMGQLQTAMSQNTMGAAPGGQVAPPQPGQSPMPGAQ